MIRLVTDTVKDTIESLAWVERYGGLSFPATTEIADGEGGTLKKTVPITNYLSEVPCETERDRYFYLVPDDKYKSIVYFEQSGDTTFTVPTRSGSTKFRNVMVGTQNLRLIAWVNLALLGADKQVFTAHLAAELHSKVDGLKVSKLPAGDVQLGGTDKNPIQSIMWSIGSQIVRSPALFSGYSYADISALMLYPFDFFGFNVQVQFYIKKDCVDAFVPGAAIDCVDVNNDLTAMAMFDNTPMAGFGGGTLTPLP